MKKVQRREYRLRIWFNFVEYRKVIIDPHYEEKHAETISDIIILRLVRMLDGRVAEAEDVDEAFAYFVEDQMELNGKFYKLIWLVEENEEYIGIVNAYRR